MCRLTVHIEVLPSRAALPALILVRVRDSFGAPNRVRSHAPFFFGEVAKWLGNGLQNRPTPVRIRSSPHIEPSVFCKEDAGLFVLVSSRIGHIGTDSDSRSPSIGKLLGNRV